MRELQAQGTAGGQETSAAVEGIVVEARIIASEEASGSTWECLGRALRKRERSQSM